MAGTLCALYYCKNYQRDTSWKSFFRFPKEKTTCDKWVYLCRRSDLDAIYREKGPPYMYQTYRLCSDHFKLSDFRNPRQSSQGIKPGSIPTQNMFGKVVSEPVKGSPRKREPNFTGSEEIIEPTEQVLIRPTAGDRLKPRSIPTQGVLSKDVSKPMRWRCTKKELRSEPNFTDTEEIIKPPEQVLISPFAVDRLKPKGVPTQNMSGKDISKPMRRSPRKRELKSEPNFTSTDEIIQPPEHIQSRPNAVGLTQKTAGISDLKTKMLQLRLKKAQKTINKQKLLVKKLSSQVKNLNKGKRYSEYDKNRALALYYGSSKSYLLLRKLFCLPTVRCVKDDWKT